MGKGQTVQASANYSSYSKSVQLGFTEPYLFDRNISLGGDIYRRDFENFNFVNNDRNTTYKQLPTGGQVRVGVPLTEYMRSEEHTSELQSLMRNSYAVFCLKTKN